jgi:hypothetical protein
MRRDGGGSKEAPNPRLERTGGRPIWHEGASVAAGRSSVRRSRIPS